MKPWIPNISKTILTPSMVEVELSIPFYTHGIVLLLYLYFLLVYICMYILLFIYKLSLYMDIKLNLTHAHDVCFSVR